MTVVKICGLTNLEDAHAALDAGADLLGFNFYPPSPRYVAPETVAEILRALHAWHAERPFRCVGVFVNSPADEVRAILAQCGLDLAQCHGDEPPEQVAALGALAYKALRPAALEDADGWAAEYWRARSMEDQTPPAFLLDASHPRLYGGTGQTGDWHVARTFATRYPILLAGGLTPGNVAVAVRAVAPWGVDVASGVESASRRKDAAKLRAFVAATQSATSG